MYLAALGLGCSVRGALCSRGLLSLLACGLSGPQGCGVSVPHPGMEPEYLPCKAGP